MRLFCLSTGVSCRSLVYLTRSSELLSRFQFIRSISSAKMSTVTVVSPKALATGSQDPPLTPGVFRLYSMRFCPYVYKVRLVMEAKKIPYEIVNCHLQKKPEWLFAKENPDGKVPVLERDDQILTESLVISEYLDELHPQPKLQPSDPYTKAKHKLLVEKQSKMNIIARKALFQKLPEEIPNLLKEIEYFEKYLVHSKKPYFAGDKPGMVDYMMWPHFEVILAVKELIGSEFEIFVTKFPKLKEYLHRMVEDPVVKATAVPLDLMRDFYKTILDGKADYDLGL